ncbi:cytokine-like nuclear factor N-PAC isoform X2 [Artemia franciscana]|uniref:Cytokine-like nuclear factor N-PAC n=1 Tax=Artemia franciscana TaxID=6661 RepID=A0AA88L1N7_ARTSF|nr:hypothetical protein QYM36_011760 [Artemia franciscana]
MIYHIGDLVWAKMKGFSPWPGMISLPPEDLKKPKSNKTIHCVFFFGSENYAWIEEQNVKPYARFKEQFSKSNKFPSFKEGLAAIEKASQERKNEEKEKTEVEDEVSDKSRTIEEKSENKKETPKAKKRTSSVKSVKKESKTPNGGSTKKKARKENGRAESPDLPLSTIVGPATKKPSSSANSFLNRPNLMPVKPAGFSTLDIHKISDTLKDKKIEPSTLQFGFLGVGIMGSGIVKNLINSGHKVNVWNRSADKCKDFIDAGATQLLTPADVVSSSDVTFSCLSDPIVVKELVFGNCGVLQGISPGKKYVEMTSIDAETSQDLHEGITAKGGVYLEAQIQGNKAKAEEGSLVVLAAGDRGLFDECQSAFSAMGTSAFFLGEVGMATKLNLVLQLMMGVSMNALAEGFALADRAGLNHKDVLEVLELTQLASPLLVEKGKAIIDGNFPTAMALSHMQKDLKLALNLGDQLEQPLPVTAAANEVFKHTKRFGYADHDVSAIYLRARF